MRASSANSDYSRQEVTVAVMRVRIQPLALVRPVEPGQTYSRLRVDLPEVRVRSDESIDDMLILLGKNATGAIDERATLTNKTRRILQHSQLDVSKLTYTYGINHPLSCR